jgi:hypothetical protein
MARGKPLDRDRARALRAEGWTLPAICEELDVSRASVSVWCRDIPVPFGEWTRRLRAPESGRKKGTLQLAKEAEIERLRAEGRDRLADLTEREHLVAGLMLYAGEGAKGGSTVKVANTNPLLVGFFCGWLRRHFDIDESRLRFCVYLHEGLDLDAAVEHWSLVTGIPSSQTTKPYRAVVDASRRTVKHEFGCCYVSYCSTTIHRSITGMLEALVERS